MTAAAWMTVNVTATGRLSEGVLRALEIQQETWRVGLEVEEPQSEESKVSNWMMLLAGSGVAASVTAVLYAMTELQ